MKYAFLFLFHVYKEPHSPIAEAAQPWITAPIATQAAPSAAAAAACSADRRSTTALCSTRYALSLLLPVLFSSSV